MSKRKIKGPVLKVGNLAQIRSGEVEFGDLTLLVGAQASGKSIFLQLMKLLVDRHPVFAELEQQAFNWQAKDFDRLLELYFGESMSGIWKADTEVEWLNESYTKDRILNRQGTRANARQEKMFYIPAQRVVTMYQGFPRPFTGFDAGDPYILKSFSETLRVMMEQEFSNGRSQESHVFPRPGKMSSVLRSQIASSVFNGGTINLDRKSLRKRYLLEVGNSELPYMTWSAGQKEFMPLLLSLYHLLPSGNLPKKDSVEWVVMEEPEMGLHPRAIQTVMLLTLQLMQRGYRVVISTHSPVLLELAWVIRFMQKYRCASDDLFDLFDLKRNAAMKEIFDAALQKEFKTWFFDRTDDGVQVRDISSLDAGDPESGTSSWGGLSEFAGRAAEVVSKVVAAHG